MAEFQVEIEFAPEGFTRDVDVLERLGRELEEIAGDMGPAAAIIGERYAVVLIVQAEELIEAGRRGAEAVVEALERALGEEVDASSLDRLLVGPRRKNSLPPEANGSPSAVGVRV